MINLPVKITMVKSAITSKLFTLALNIFAIKIRIFGKLKLSIKM